MIIGTMLCCGRAEVVKKAVKSAKPLVDKLLVLLTCPTAIENDETLSVICDEWEACGGEGGNIKFIIHEWKDFGTARNAALQEASVWLSYIYGTPTDDIRSNDWAMTIDSDEVMICNEYESVRQLVMKAGLVDVFHVKHIHGYSKERFIRLGAGKWVGKTHEFLSVSGPKSHIDESLLVFTEERQQGDYVGKITRDIKLLLEMLSDPATPQSELQRWHYYLGQSYQGYANHYDSDHHLFPKEFSRDVIFELGRHHYLMSTHWATYPEMRAWGMYHAASLKRVTHVYQGSRDEAADIEPSLAFEYEHAFAHYPLLPEIAYRASLSHCRGYRLARAKLWALVGTAFDKIRGKFNIVRTGTTYDSAVSTHCKSNIDWVDGELVNRQSHFDSELLILADRSASWRRKALQEQNPKMAMQCAINAFCNMPCGDYAWLVAFYAHKAGDWWACINWSKLSVALGFVRGIAAEMPRAESSVRDTIGLFDGPFDLLSRYGQECTPWVRQSLKDALEARKFIEPEVTREAPPQPAICEHDRPTQ